MEVQNLRYTGTLSKRHRGNKTILTDQTTMDLKT